jgi:hypothetical protein
MFRQIIQKFNIQSYLEDVDLWLNDIEQQLNNDDLRKDLLEEITP